MTPIKHHLCNDVLRRPPEMTEEECADLHIMRGDEGGVASFWVPNAEELRALCAGSPICIGFVGNTHPPMSIGVLNLEQGASG